MKHSDPSAELTQLRARNRELKEQIAQLHAQLEAELALKAGVEAQLEAELALKAGLEAQLQEALLELAELKRQLFGERSDQLTPEEEAQMAEVAADLQDQAEQEPPLSEDVLEEPGENESDEAAPPQDAPRRKRRRRRRHPLPEHLERQTVVLEPEGLAPCEHCGCPLQSIGEEVSEELDYVPAKVIVRRTVRPKYACRCGGGGVRVAPLPPRLVPQSKLGLGLAVYLLLARFDDHVAYYTLERIFQERHDVSIPRQQMVQWVEHIACLLQPLCHRMFERMKQGGYLQVDETPVKVLDPEVKGKCGRGYLWFYAVPGGDVFLNYQGTRSRAAPHAQLSGFTGTIQTDAYEVYASLQQVIPELTRIGCAAHARRKFRRALRDGERRAIGFIASFRRLYQIEAQTRDLTAPERHATRQQKAAPIWNQMRQEAQALQPRLLPQSSLGKAVSYFLNEYPALIGYLESGAYQIDNNLVENSIRVPAVGRRRWLFIGHPEAGWRSAVIYSIILSCRRRGLNPQTYLTDVLRRLPALNITQLDPLLPEHWQPQPTKDA